ncbi:ATP-binding cassette domain-containing protein [Leadbetterella byssophila]|uniref:ABC transporter ATP-binding protein n=1 Tax=Leadbetterella byssophila TaxID=316068 RepID=UPI0039A2DD41
MLKLEAYSKAYSGHTIIERSDLEIPMGIHWVKGQNGSGKSTLFRSIGGIIPFDGNILWKEKDLKKNPVAYRLCVNLGEAEPLYPEFLSGWDILKFVAEAKRAEEGQLFAFGELFGSDQYWKQPIGTYSSGMTKKIGIIAAFLGSPELILLDEPLVTLDKGSIQKLVDLILEKYKKESVSFLLSSHQDTALEALPITQFYEVKYGRIYEQNTLSDLG